MKKQFVIITSIFVFVFAVILNKMVNERNVQRLGQTFSEIYDDRLLVESYIYQLTDLFYKKKILVIQNEGLTYSTLLQREMLKQTSEIAVLTGKYASTRLTRSEQLVFEKLKENVALLKDAEAALLLRGNAPGTELKRICQMSLLQLRQLSSIQVSEGNLLKENGRRVLSASHMAVQLEWAVFLIIALLSVSVLRKKKLFSDIFPKYQLN